MPALLHLLQILIDAIIIFLCRACLFLGIPVLLSIQEMLANHSCLMLCSCLLSYQLFNICIDCSTPRRLPSLCLILVFRDALTRLEREGSGAALFKNPTG